MQFSVYSFLFSSTGGCIHLLVDNRCRFDCYFIFLRIHLFELSTHLRMVVYRWCEYEAHIPTQKRKLNLVVGGGKGKQHKGLKQIIISPVSIIEIHYR